MAFLSRDRFKRTKEEAEGEKAGAEKVQVRES